MSLRKIQRQVGNVVSRRRSLKCFALVVTTAVIFCVFVLVCHLPACLLRLRICQMCHHQPSRLSGMNRFVSYLRWLGLSQRCSKTTFIGLLGLSGIFSGISGVRPGTYLVQKADRAVTPLSSTSLMVGETAPNQVGNIQAQTSVKFLRIVKIYAKHCKPL